MKPGEIAGPFDVGGGVVIARLKERKDADMADYEKRKEEIQRGFAETKYGLLLTSWTQSRCTELKTAGGISVNDELLFPEAQAAGKQLYKYEPCSTSRFLGF
jgi:hypothetical protein